MALFIYTDMEPYRSILFKTKSTDVDEKGIVKVAVNGIGIKDSDGDISSPGSFSKTLQENFNRCKWFLNHDKTKLLGCPIEGVEEDGNLVMTGQINLKKQIGVETLEDYKLYRDHGKTLEHSVGVRAVKRDSNNPAIVKEWFLGEYSTLTHWGANPQTFLMDIKELRGSDLRDHINMMRDALNKRYSGDKLKALEANISIVEKALIGSNIVQCPQCGLAFDYGSVPEHTLESQVIDAVGDYSRWITEDVVYQEMEKIKPELQDRILEIINSKKSVDDFASYVRCPKCYSRIYRSNTLISEPEDSTQIEKHKAARCTLGSLGDLINNN